MSTDSSQPGKASLWGLLGTQFSNAFNDNAWKLMVPLLALRNAATTASQDPASDTPASLSEDLAASAVDALQQTGLDESAQQLAQQDQMTLAMLAFTLPLIVLSLPAGTIADRFSKRSLLLATKWLEFTIMVGVTFALARPEYTHLPLILLGLLGLQSALLSPAKYGILPQIVGHDRLAAANGALSMWTFVAIIAGTLGGGALLSLPAGRMWLAGVALVLMSAAGLVCARYIPHVSAAGQRSDSVGTVMRTAWTAMRQDRVLWLAVWGSVVFWGMISLLGQDVLVYAKAVTRDLPNSDTLVSLPAGLFGIGIGIGSVLAGRWSAGKIEYGLIPLGAALFAGATLAMAVFTPQLLWTCILTLPLGIGAGLVVVPLNSLVQWRSPADRRGAVIAIENVFVFAAVLGGSFLAAFLGRLEFSAASILYVAAAITVASTLWAIRLLPDALLRLMLVLLTHTLYKVRVIGREHVPLEGGALLVPNHVSFVDGLFILATVDRPVRFLVDADYFRHPLLRPFMRSLKAIPISSTAEPRTILRALKDAGAYLDAGEVVCIFAEGQLTRTGMMQPFRRGLERIVKGRKAPIIPTYLDRVWGSIFSREGGRFLTKIPKQIPYPVTVAYGPPMPPETTVAQLRGAVQELSADAWQLTKPYRDPLHYRFVRTCRLHPRKFLYADLQHERVRRFGGLVGAVALARRLRSEWADQPHVGILLPPSVGAAMANTAASLAGRASVNLNYTVGPAGMASAARQAGLETVLTSRLFLEKAKLELPEGLRPLWIEDIVAEISTPARIWAAVLAMCTPVRWLDRLCGARRRIDVDDLVTIIFSSGSTGEPKGVMLSHFNVGCNVDSAAQTLRFEVEDRVVGILPLFHSFGFVALWFVNNHGMGIAFQANPVDAIALGQLVQRYRLTILVATPTFLQIYQRRCSPAQFGSLRLVIVGAEKLPAALAQSFEDHFGVRPLEGYGTTECAPMVSANVPDFRAPGFYQPGSRRGTVGQPLPGIAVKIIDPDSGEPLGLDEPGMLLVKGPNVMFGYIGRPELTDEVIRDGWYVTGDIAKLDDDRFITITGRLSRFSKIGGEMVPHGAVEEALHEAGGYEEQVFAVTAIPDAKKGEALAVLHTISEDTIPAVLDRMSDMGLPNLFLPRRDNFIRVDAIPLLGTGKLDLKGIKDLARSTLLGDA